MEPRCSRCDAPIEKQAKGYKRKSLLSLTDPRSARRLFPDLNPAQAFLCFGCVRLVYQRTKKCGKKRVYVDPQAPSRPAPAARPALSIPEELPPPKKKLKQRLKTAPNEHDYACQYPEPPPRPDPPPTRPDPPPTRRARRGPIPQICGYLQKKNLSSALNLLLQVSGFREALTRTCSKIIGKERKALVNDLDGPYRKTFSPDSLSAFSWDKTTSWAEEKAPLTVACLRAMFPPAKKIQKQTVNHGRRSRSRRLTEAEVKQLLDRRISVLLSVPLYTSSLRACFLQTAFSVEMLRHRCPVKLFNIMNSLGLSQCKTAARVHAKRLAAEHQQQVQRWKEEIQTSRWTQYCCNESKKGATFSFSWGRVRVPSVCRVDSDRGYSFETWAFRFAHQARVNFRYLHGAAIKAVEVSPYSILPTRRTYEALRQRMKTIVMRIIGDNLKALRGPRGRVERHIPHAYSHLMKEASTTVSLGAVIPDSSEETVSAAYGLDDYIPVVAGKPYHLLCCGDVLNTDNTEAPKTQNNQTPPAAAAPKLRFDRLIEAPQEFQKEHLFHEEMMKMLLSEQSACSRGTLRHINSLFHFKTFNNTARDYFLNVWDFITFVTTAYVTLFAVTDCGLDSVDQRPSDYPSQVSDQMDWLSGLAHRLLDLVWMPPPQEDINTAAAAAAAGRDDDVFPFCYCGEERPGEKLLRCCSNLCPRIWFHEGCARAQVRSDPQEEDWFCGPDCGADGTYVYCHCKEQRGGQMVQCGRMERCRRHEWYHRDCLTAAEQSGAEQTPWYCSEACSLAVDCDDFLLNYTKAVVWEGLYHMARRDAIQEGDGDAMMDFWRMDLVLLWTRDHLQLFNSGHQLLAGMEGFYPEWLRQDLKWNRVLNLQGTEGGNLSLDLVTEVVISEFKGVIEFGKGSFTRQQVEYSAQLAGRQASDLDRLFFTGGIPLNLSTYVSRLTSSSCRRKEDVFRFVDEFRKDELFAFKPGRKHRGFDTFSYQQRVKKPGRMGRSLRRLAEELDKRRDKSSETEPAEWTD